MPYKTKSGIIPLFILIAVGIAILGAGGVYIIQQNFVKTGKSGKTALDEDKIRQQIANSTPLPTPAAEPSAKLAAKEFTYAPQAKDQTNGEPGFNINPPSGWLSTSAVSTNQKAHFEAPDEDKEDGEKGSGLVVNSRAGITVQMQSLGPSLTLALFVDGIKEKSSNDFEKIEYLSETKTNLNGTETVRIETKSLRKGVWIHSIDYLFAKDGYAIALSGTSFDSAWSKRSGAISASLASFTLK
jgi:hypothetical protein